jgi:iron complex outermembrane receptor protein
MKMFPNFSSAIVFAVLLINVIYVQAVAAESNPEIEEIVVRASLLHDAVEADAVPLHVLGQSQLSTQPSLSLGEYLDGLTGVTVADYGSGVGHPVIRGLSGNRVKVLENGRITRDISGLGGDHINEVDTANAQQVEVVRGPASLLFANGSIGGIVNVVDDAIARTDVEETTLNASVESQSVNDGEAASLSATTSAFGINWSYAGSYSNLNNYDVPNGALEHDEHHEEEHDDEDHDEEEHGEEHDLGILENSDTQRSSHKFGLSKTGDWGYVGGSYSRKESVYGIPVHADEHEGHGDEEHGDEEHGDEDHEEAGHGDEDHDDHDEHGEDERIFSTTKSDVWTIEGRLNNVGRFINSIDFSYQDSDYSLTEQHAEEEGHDEEEGDDDHDEHEDEGPTLFTNESQEIDLRFNLDSDQASHRIVTNFSQEEVAIIGEEAFMRPTESKEITLGYYFSREWPNGFHIDLGARFDNLDRQGSVAHEDEDHHDEDHDEDHDDEHGDEDHGDEDHDEEVEIDTFDLNYKTSSLALNLTRAFENDISLSLGLASIERAPSVVEMFINGPHLAAQRYEVGDPTLSSERGFNTEISLSIDRPNYFMSLTLFNNEINDYIYLQDEMDDHDEEEHEEEHEEEEHGHGGLISAAYQQEDASFSGYEFEIGTSIDFDIGQLTFTYARDQTNASLNSGPRVPRIAPARDTFTVDGAISGFDTRLSYQRVSDQSRVAENEEPTDGYDMLNLSVTRTFSLGASELDVTVYGRNLLDEVARRHTSFVKEEAPLPGRNMGVKLHYRL